MKSALESSGKKANGAVKAMAKDRGLKCEEILVQGRPPKAIIEVSDEIGADLIVVGSTGMTSVERVLIDSESEKVLRYSKRAVLLVRDL